MYKSQFWKFDPYDWFCGPGPHLLLINSMYHFWINYTLKKKIVSEFIVTESQLKLKHIIRYCSLIFRGSKPIINLKLYSKSLTEEHDFRKSKIINKML